MDSGSNVPSQQGQKEAFLNGLSQFLADKGWVIYCMITLLKVEVEYSVEYFGLEK